MTSSNENGASGGEPERAAKGMSAGVDEPKRATLADVAREYVERYGMHLVETDGKQPKRPNWPTETISEPDRAFEHWRRHASDNIGVVLGPSRLCSLDADDLLATRDLMAEFGIDVDELARCYPTVQGSRERLRILFRVPPGLELARHAFIWPSRDDPTKSAVIFELRAGAAQDLLPPSMHPEGMRYQWMTPLGDGPRDLPPRLLTIWQQWDVFKRNAAALCPWAPRVTTHNAPQASWAPRDGGSVIAAWNAAHSLEATLSLYGYEQVGRRWLSPHSGTKVPGVVIFDAGRCYIHHASDPLCSDESGKPVNAFDLFAHYEHGGNVRAAVRAAGAELGMRVASYGRAEVTANAAPADAAQLGRRDRVTAVRSERVRPAGVLDFAPTEAFDRCTQVANAGRIVRHLGDRLMHVTGIGWHAFGPPWKHDEGEAQRLAQGLGRIIAAEAADLAQWAASSKDSDEREKRQAQVVRMFRWASVSESAACIAASLHLAEPHLSVRADELDADPMLLGTPGGVLDLKTGEFRAQRQGDRITKSTTCAFDPNANAPTWERFVTRIFDGDAELVRFVQRVVGLSLSGLRREHLLIVAYGIGANGKSTFFGAIQRLLGEYASTAAPGLLMAKAGMEHPTALADLQGRRLVIASESGEKGRLHEERVKALTGGDRITARRMREDFYSFAPTHLLVLQTNHKPVVTGTDEGIWRRLRMIPFAITIPENERDPDLPARLELELQGIFAWAFRGWLDYQMHGLGDAAAVRSATAEYRTASDVLAAFLAECCTADKNATTTSADLYRAYTNWCEETGERASTQRDLGMRLSERGFERVRYGGGYRYRGVRLGASVPSEGYEPFFGMSPQDEKTNRIHIEKAPICSLRALTNCPRCSGEGCPQCGVRAGAG